MAQRSDGLGPTFSALLTATFVTNLGDGLRLAALPLLATTLTSSPILISGVTAAQFLPWMLFAPFGGVIVDRSDRRRLIMITQAWRSLVMVALALAVLTDLVQVWQLFVVAFVITVGEILVDPSVVATVPTIVEPSNLDRANSRITMVETVTNEFVGGPVGAASFALVPWLPFVLDALSYAGSIAPFSRLPASRVLPRQEKPLAHEERRSIRSEMGDGLRWIKGHPFLRPLTLGIAVFHLGTAGAFSLLVILVVDVLQTSAIVFGIVLSAAAIGATASSLVAARLVDRFSRRAVITLAATVTAFSVITSGIVSNEWQLIVAWTLNGAGGGLSLSIGRGFIQRHTPNHLLGRTAIASRMLTRPSFVVGALLAGVIASWSSVRWSFVVAGLFHLLGALLLWRSFEHEPD